MATIKYGDFERDTGNLPAASVNALLARGFAHFMGNEQASKVSARIRKAISEAAGKTEDGKPKLPTDSKALTREMIAAYREANEEQVAKWEDEVREAALAVLDAGTIGVHAARGPSRDPVETAMRAMAKSEIVTILKAQGLKFPTGENVVTLGEQEFTGDELIERRIAREEDRLRKAAEKQVADARRAKDRLIAEASKAEGKTADALGL